MRIEKYDDFGFPYNQTGRNRTNWQALSGIAGEIKKEMEGKISLLQMIAEAGGLSEYRQTKNMPPELCNLLDRTLIDCAIGNLPVNLDSTKTESIGFDGWLCIKNWSFFVSAPFDISIMQVAIWSRNPETELDLKPAVGQAYRSVNELLDKRLGDLRNAKEIKLIEPIIVPWLNFKQDNMRFVVLAGVGSNG